MKIKSLIGLFIGISLVGFLVAWQGLEAVSQQFAVGGWSILLVCFFAIPSFYLSGEAWRCLFPKEHRPPITHTFLASSMGTAINILLPVASIGGEVAKARILALWSHSGKHAVSTVVVDKTAQAIVILIWGITGTVMLATLVNEPTVVKGAIIGAILLALGIIGFVFFQHSGSMSFLARFGAKIGGAEKWRGIIANADEVDKFIREIYRRPFSVLAACSLRLSIRIILVGEVVLAGHLLGFPIGFGEALMLKGLVIALRGLSFAIPAGLGIQEGGYIAIGALIGLPPDLMIATSLITRVREVLPSIPFLLLWQHTEGRALWRKHQKAESDKQSSNR
ncbi:lysylphosphatidylglycerol synthase domain-containing protein [Alphaproteobacteria bacterium]|nr:lysylphosphatidylglycerol synthase domain-containing protein [Alphaproteobacteria bacterium]